MDNTDLWLAMRQTKYNRTLNNIAEVFTQKYDDPLTVVSKAFDMIVNAMHAEAGTLWVHQKYGDGRIYPKAVFQGTLPEGFSLAYGEGLAGKTIENNKGVIVADCQADPRWAGKADAATGFVTKSMIVAPMQDRNQCYGCIQIINKTDGLLFDDMDFDFGQQLAKGVGKMLADRHIAEVLQTGVEVSDVVTFDELIHAVSENEMVEALMRNELYSNLPPRKQKKIIRHMSEVKEIINKAVIISNADF